MREKETLEEFKNRIKSMTPPDLANEIDSLEYMCWFLNHEAADGRIPNDKGIDDSIAIMRVSVAELAAVFAEKLQISKDDTELMKQKIKENIEEYKRLFQLKFFEFGKIGTVFSITHKDQEPHFFETVLGMYRQFQGVPDHVSILSGGFQFCFIGADYNDPTKMYEFEQRYFSKEYKIENLQPRLIGSNSLSRATTELKRRSITAKQNVGFLIKPSVFRYSGPRKDIKGVYDPMTMYERVIPNRRGAPIQYPKSYFINFVLLAKNMEKPILAEFVAQDMRYIQILNNVPRVYNAKESYVDLGFRGGKIF